MEVQWLPLLECALEPGSIRTALQLHRRGTENVRKGYPEQPRVPSAGRTVNHPRISGPLVQNHRRNSHRIPLFRQKQEEKQLVGLTRSQQPKRSSFREPLQPLKKVDNHPHKAQAQEARQEPQRQPHQVPAQKQEIKDKPLHRQRVLASAHIIPDQPHPAPQVHRQEHHNRPGHPLPLRPRGLAQDSHPGARGVQVAFRLPAVPVIKVICIFLC